MAVKCVCLESDAYMVCLTHALSTEREEVMGLLIGEVLLLLFSLDNVNGQGSYQWGPFALIHVRITCSP